jgi:hypothetical protein
MTKAVALLAAFVVTCSASRPGREEAVPDEMFVLCNRSPGGYGGIALDYRALLGHFDDHGLHVMTCGTSAPCISFPLLLSVPPSLPEPGRVLQWREGGHFFSIRRTGGSSGDYEIDVVEARRGPNSPPSDRYHYGYSVRRGITSYRREGEARELRLCRGRLTFEDLRRLRPRLIPDSRHDPALQAQFEGPLDMNIVLDAPQP